MLTENETVKTWREICLVLEDSIESDVNATLLTEEINTFYYILASLSAKYFTYRISGYIPAPAQHVEALIQNSLATYKRVFLDDIVRDEDDNIQDIVLTPKDSEDLLGLIDFLVSSLFSVLAYDPVAFARYMEYLKNIDNDTNPEEE